MVRYKKNVVTLFNLSILILFLIGISYMVEVLSECGILNIVMLNSMLNNVIMVFFGFLNSSGIMWVIGCFVVAVLVSSVTKITVSYLNEMRRQSIISPYILTLNDVKARLMRGYKVYAEKYEEGVFVKLYKRGSELIIERLGDGKIIKITGESLLEKIDALQIDEGYSIYDEMAYEKMLSSGYGV